MTKLHVAHIPILLTLHTAIQGNPFTEINTAASEYVCKQLLGYNYTLGFRNNSARTSIPLVKLAQAPRGAKHPDLLFVNILLQHHKVYGNLHCFKFADLGKVDENLQSGKVDMVFSDKVYAEKITVKSGR